MNINKKEKYKAKCGNIEKRKTKKSKNEKQDKYTKRQTTYK